MRVSPRTVPIALLLVLSSCGGRSQTGVDEHGNALSSRIQVVDRDGIPQKGVEVVVRPTDWLPGMPLDSSGSTPDAMRQWTDHEGFCVLRGLRSGIYALRAGDSLLARRIDLEQGASEESLRLVLDSVGALTGEIQGGRPGLRVAITGLDLTTRTDSSGRFVLPFAPRGSHRLAIGEPGHVSLVSPVEVHPGRATELTPLRYDSLDPREIVATGTETTRLLPAMVDPPPGVYRDPLLIRAFAALPGDSLYVSQGGTTWTPWSDRTLHQNSCLLLKTVRATAAYFPIRMVCYTLSS